MHARAPQDVGLGLELARVDLAGLGLGLALGLALERLVGLGLGLALVLVGLGHELALDVLDALLEYAKIQLPEAPAATLVFNGTSNTIGAAFDETEPASTSDLSEQLAVQSGDLVLELATAMRVSFATARRALMARRFQYDKAHSDVYTALFLNDALKRDEEERFTADMRALAEAHALSESRFLYEQDREQQAQELSHQLCVSPTTARAALVEHVDVDKARYDLQSRLADDNFRRQEHFIYKESEHERIERLQHVIYQYDAFLQQGDSHQGQPSRFSTHCATPSRPQAQRAHLPGACCNLTNGALCFVCCLVSFYDITT